MQMGDPLIFNYCVSSEMLVGDRFQLVVVITWYLDYQLPLQQ
jgi:hypothetical protein